MLVTNALAAKRITPDDNSGDLKSDSKRPCAVEKSCSAPTAPSIESLSRQRSVKKSSSFELVSVIRRSHSIEEASIDKMNYNRAPKPKVINDSIHGHIRFPSVAVAIIDTPQFQRLRFLKQLGSCHFVYPTATHTRFQHSLGVAHLAFKFASHLRKENPTRMDEKDVLCVMIAGLCHDLGHGPYSHLWEYFVHEAGGEWHHEITSVQMFDYLIKDNDLMPIFKSEAGINETDILFIKELIAGPINPVTGLPTMEKPDEKSPIWYYKGRPEEKSFLYEIVANKGSGIDVDKWDYFLRDDYCLKIGHVFEYERFIQFSRIMETGPTKLRTKICLRDKEAELVEEMFRDRARLHRQGYQHRVTKIIDRMMVDAFLIADKHIKIMGSNKKMYSLSEACQDVVAHEKLTDEQIFYKILDCDNPAVEEAKELLQRILKRNFYRKVIEINVKKESRLRDKSEAEILSEILSFVGQSDPNCSIKAEEMFQAPLRKDEVVVLRRKIDKGMGELNPVRKCTFYTKDLRVKNVEVNINEQIQIDLTFWVCCKRIESRPMRETLQAVQAWQKAMNVTDIDFDDTENDDSIEEIDENVEVVDDQPAGAFASRGSNVELEIAVNGN